MFVYYDFMTKNYVGYSKDNKTFISYKSSAHIEVINSVKDMIIGMGLENQQYNIYHISKQYKDIKIDLNNIFEKIIRIRCNNLKQCIERTISIIEKIKNNFNNKPMPYNINEYNLIAEFQKSLKHFNTKQKDDELFSNNMTIMNNITIDSVDITNVVITKQFVDTSILIDLNNMDCKLLFYYIYNMNKLIEFNDLPAIRTNLCYMIIQLIIFNYNMYYVPFENNMIRQFDSLLLTDAPYMDESQRVVGIYMDLVNTKEIDEEVVKEREYDINEEMTALDMDDYEKEDGDLDYDANDEMLERLEEQI